MNINQIELYWALLNMLKSNGFRCETCDGFDSGVCKWADRMVNKSDFCTQWWEREARHDG